MRTLVVFIILISMYLFTGCSGAPSSKLKDEQFEIIKENVKQILGERYEATNFTIVEEGFTNEEKTDYICKFTFDLNKPYLFFEGKKIPGELRFTKNKDGEWECTFNSGNVTGLFNLFKVP